MLHVSDHANAPVHSFKTIADGAESDGARVDSISEPLDLRAFIDKAGCKQYKPSLNFHITALSNEAIVPATKKCSDSPPLQCGAIQQGLVAQAAKQIRAPDTFEAWIVMTFRNQRRAAFPIVNQPCHSAVARQVGRGGQAGGPTPDDETIQHVGVPTPFKEGLARAAGFLLLSRLALGVVRVVGVVLSAAS